MDDVKQLTFFLLKDKQFKSFSTGQLHGIMACNVPEIDDGDSDTSGVVSDVASCLSQEMLTSACQTWSNANNMRRLWPDQVWHESVRSFCMQFNI